MLVGGKVASFTETIFLSQRVLFWEGEPWFFFEEEVGIVLFNLNNVVSVEKEASLRTFEDFHHFFEKTQTWIFVKNCSDARADDISCFSQNAKIFEIKKQWTT